jgi:Uncharacterized conserved protein
MKNRDRIILKKIINYIADIENYTLDFSKDSFMGDRKTISACAFTVSQIGEIAKEVSEETQTVYNTIPWRAMKGMRNKIVHDYENVDLTVLWGTIKDSLPVLKIEIEKIISVE